MRFRNPTTMIKRSMLRIPLVAPADTYNVARPPAVWMLDPDAYVVIAGRRYLAARPDLDPVECRILDVDTLEEAQALVAKKPRTRPTRRELEGFAREIVKLPYIDPEERAFLAAVEYVTKGVVKGWPPRIASLDGKLPRPGPAR